MSGRLLLQGALLVSSACFTAVPEAVCSTDSDCAVPAMCLESKCRVPDAGAAGGVSGTGGGTAGGVTPAAGGTSATGGGLSTGGGGGAATGGGGASTGGGGGSACGCTTPQGQCLPGDTTMACGASGAQCQRCARGEQCFNGACTPGACGPNTCNGCCGRGMCVPLSTQSTIACGTGGSMCSTCARGQDCVNGTCQAVTGCGPMSCAGCCAPGLDRCLNVSLQNNLACGVGGAQCSACQGGTSCLGGVCTGGIDGGPGPGSCDPASCPTGCCAFGRCVTPQLQNAFACGTGGQMCAQCAGGTTCTSGVCTRPTTPDGGPVQVFPAGSPCTSTTTCDGTCLTETIANQPTGYPGGYCTGQCGAAQPCVSGVCVSEPGLGGAVSSCRGECTGTGQGSCRTGYVCVASPASNQAYCRPSCLNAGFGAMCPQGTSCQSSGYCQ